MQFSAVSLRYKYFPDHSVFKHPRLNKVYKTWLRMCGALLLLSATP